MDTTQMVKVGNFGVDSGQIVVIDPCYVWDDDFMPNGDPTGGPYDAACRITLSKKNYGEIEGGFVTSTLYGDGTYPIYAELNELGQIVRMIIDFDPDLNWDDDDEDEDEDEDEDVDDDNNEDE